MATVTKPIALDESFKSTEQTPRNIADVLAEELARIAENILPPNAEDIAYDNTASGLTATNVQDAIDEVISSQADVIADTMADLTENKTATVTDGVADFETIDGSLVKSLVVEIEPSQSGTGTPSPDNIRPISGYTQEDVTVVGKNYLPMLINDIKAINTTGSWAGNTYTNVGMTYEIQTDGTGSLTGVKVSGTTSSYPACNLCKCSFPVGTYKFNANGIRIRIYKNEVMIADRLATSGDYTLTVDNPTDEYRISIFTGAVTLSDTMAYPILCKSTNDTTFEPYHGKTYTTAFGQTVYGGTLDVLTGELTIDRAMVQITASDITFNATNNRAMLSLTTASLPRAVDNYSGVNCIADRFEGISNQSGASTGVGVYANNAYIALCGYKTSLADYQTWLTDNPVTVVYEIATPTTLSLTPQKVKSLVGENHIQASTGDVLECKYSMLINGDDLAQIMGG